MFDYFDGLVSALYTAAWLLYLIEWLSGEVIRWIIETKTTSLVGSTQNQVPAAPSQKNVPLPSDIAVSGGPKITATFKPVAETASHHVLTAQPDNLRINDKVTFFP